MLVYFRKIPISILKISHSATKEKSGKIFSRLFCSRMKLTVFEIYLLWHCFYICPHCRLWMKLKSSDLVVLFHWLCLDTI
jgi:hypothetical protein